MTHFLLRTDRIIDVSTKPRELEYLKEQIAVAEALKNNPIIFNHMIKQLEMNVQELLDYTAVQDSDSLAKVKVTRIQAANAATKYYLDLVANIGPMVEKLHQITTDINQE